MRYYSNAISLSKNSRGVYSLDPTLGCASGTKESKNGCYNDCYAARIARIYGYDFSKTVLRGFTSKSHLHETIKEISKVPLPFIRMGTMGDPSEAWGHTLAICEQVQKEYQLRIFGQEKKEIVIITKHWTNLTDGQLNKLGSLKICVNTSVSALDNSEMLENSLLQFERLKPFCRSILRIVSCDFNNESDEGKRFAEIQRSIFNNYNCLDTVFRVSKSNRLVKEGVINTHRTKFLGKNCTVSKFNKKTYFGKCGTCLEMCGVTMKK